VCQAAENVSCLLFHVMQGEEVCINYLGSNSMAPLSQRQQALQDGYGFSCGCARCRAEGVAELSAARAAAEVRLFWFVTALTELSAAQAAAEVRLFWCVTALTHSSAAAQAAAEVRLFWCVTALTHSSAAAQAAAEVRLFWFATALTHSSVAQAAADVHLF